MNTCDHGAAGIEQDLFVLPRTQPFLPGRLELSWWTDIEDPNEGDWKDRLGLQSRSLLNCDRTEFRYTPVGRGETGALLIGWRTFRNAHRQEPEWMRACSALELGRASDHWWVAVAPVPVEPA